MVKEIRLDEKEICEKYTSTTIGVEALATEYKVGKKKVKEILSSNGIPLKKRGAQHSKKSVMVDDWRKSKYPEKEGWHFVAVDRKTGFKTNDHMNKAGILTTYIQKEYGVQTPSLYDRREYYRETGDYWWDN